MELEPTRTVSHLDFVGVSTPATDANDLNAIEVFDGMADSHKVLLSDEAMWQCQLYIYILLCGVVSMSGTVCNTINMIIFSKLGIKDSMSVCLMSLSVTDFLVSFILTLNRVFFIWNIFYTGEGVDPLAVNYVAPVFLADSFFLCSGWILTFLSVERCFCVVFPFTVKQVFTKRRSIIVVATIYLLIGSRCVPIFATQWMGWVNSTVTLAVNESKVRRNMVVVFSDNREEVYTYMAIISSTVIPGPALVLTFVSVLWMVYGLVASSNVRRTMTIAERENGDSKLTQKTRKLVIVVLVLAVLFLVFSVPRIIGYSIQLILPEVNENRRNRNFNNLIWQVARVSASLNASVNILVYLNINSAYRDKFRELFTYKQAVTKNNAIRERVPQSNDFIN